MSRAKFEEWARSKGYDLDKLEEEFESLLTCAAHEGWLAGRESMMDEAADKCKESQKGDGRAQARYVTAGNISDAIRKIEP